MIVLWPEEEGMQANGGDVGVAGVRR